MYVYTRQIDILGSHREPGESQKIYNARNINSQIVSSDLTGLEALSEE